MGAWLKTHPSKRTTLDRVTFEAEGLWHVVNLYSAGVGNDGNLPKAELHAAVGRKISETRAHKLAAQLIRVGLWADAGDIYTLVDWLKDQPAAAVWDDDTQRDRWARGKALRRDRDLCKRIQQRDANLCRYCGTRVNWTDRKGKNGGTYDHVDPDGANTLDNVVVACRSCNGRKKDRTPEQAGMPLLTTIQLRALLATSSRPTDLAPVRSESDRPDPDLAPARSESDREPDSLAYAREAGPGQIGARSGLDRPGRPTPASGQSETDTELALMLEPHAPEPEPDVDHLLASIAEFVA